MWDSRLMTMICDLCGPSPHFRKPPHTSSCGILEQVTSVLENSRQSRARHLPVALGVVSSCVFHAMPGTGYSSTIASHISVHEIRCIALRLPQLTVRRVEQAGPQAPCRSLPARTLPFTVS